MKATLVIITGRENMPIQGVWYRQGCKEAALEAGVMGWVKNLLDGRVQAFFYGEDDHVDAMVQWCMNFHGKATPLELDVEEQDLECLGTLPDTFTVIR